ncbi:hypothetical protein KIH74_22570 [Kineosporia sp. J2-2]|uniref:SWIM-type domain-containing protein n=1 Tax=Kineosporia corallincola TaxID=2835133 RepID=A0ABS5TKX3_9ACTN|nr:hypothetical protein [Kineosporia corallincola]MBT0771742.1 hypothetical protein [Kineosporia corallincola]
MGDYRVGRHQSRNLYRGDEYIGVVTHETNLGPALVAKLNNPAGRSWEIVAALAKGQDVWIRFRQRWDRLAVMFNPADAEIVAAALETKENASVQCPCTRWEQGEDPCPCGHPASLHEVNECWAEVTT